jgi:hypothetical protein
MKICRENPDLSKPDKNVRQFFIVGRRHNYGPKAFLCNTQYFYIVGSDRKINNTPSTVTFSFTYW